MVVGNTYCYEWKYNRFVFLVVAEITNYRSSPYDDTDKPGFSLLVLDGQVALAGFQKDEMETYTPGSTLLVAKGSFIDAGSVRFPAEG